MDKGKNLHHIITIKHDIAWIMGIILGRNYIVMKNLQADDLTSFNWKWGWENCNMRTSHYNVTLISSGTQIFADHFL